MHNMDQTRTAGTEMDHSLTCTLGCLKASLVQSGKIVRFWIGVKCIPHAFLYTDFQVTERLPNVTFDLGRNWAGNIPVGRAGPNNTLFFWAFEKEEGSLTAGAGERSDEPWGIFLNS